MGPRARSASSVQGRFPPDPAYTLGPMSYGNGPFGPPPPGGLPPGGGPPGYGGPPGGGPPGYGPPPGGAPPGGPPGYGPPAGGYGAANPYQAPGALQATPGAGGAAAPGGALKWLFIAGHALYWIFVVGGTLVGIGIQSGGGGSDAAAVASMIPLLGVFFILGAMIIGTVWVYKAWQSVPDQMRYTDAGKWITPGQACGYLYIPFYNLYWTFIANLGVCEAINRTLVSQGKPPRAPKGLAIAASVTQIVPYCNIFVAPILWTVYMFMVDGARREMLDTPG